MPDSTTRTEYAPRRRRLQESLGSHGLDAVLLCPSADLKYWLGDAVDTVVAEDNQVIPRNAAGRPSRHVEGRSGLDPRRRGWPSGWDPDRCRR
jgi:Xaa-Pro aminopeptidase